ncbi:MAG: hypothetical protein EP318_09215 [Rhodobacteraceae bacterium]|nr:MAG: hypothetical protein EP318_09215 [Paracoccaceae bacterium]
MDKLTLYFDRNFGKRLPNALAKLRAPAEIRWHQGQGFPQNMPDDEWMEIVGEKDWVVLTQDIKFHLINHEIEAVRQHGIRCFYFPDGNSGMWKTLCTFIKCHNKILELSHETQPPFIFRVHGNGSIRAVYLPEDHLK